MKEDEYVDDHNPTINPMQMVWWYVSGYVGSVFFWKLALGEFTSQEALVSLLTAMGGPLVALFVLVAAVARVAHMVPDVVIW